MTPTRDRRPSYFKAAFANVYNLTLLAGVTVAAAATGEPWLLGVGLAAEALWLLFATDNKRFQRAVNARLAEQERLEAIREMQQHTSLLPTDERQRVQSVGIRAAEIKAECQRNPRISGEFLTTQLDRLDTLVGEFVHLSLTAHRCETYLARSDAKTINRDREAQRRIIESSADEETRRIARQNMEILERRLSTIEDLGRFTARARGQMSLIENTLSLLRDQVMTMTTPEAINTQLDSLVASVDAIREATRSAELVVGPPVGDAVPAPTELESLRAFAEPPAEVRETTGKHRRKVRG